MTRKTWKATEELMRLFQGVGRASLLADLQDSHSGNMAVKHTDEAGNEWLVITATGSQKGDLDPSQICFLSPTETDFGYYKASSETDVHARVLSRPGVLASMHAHTKEIVIVTMDDEPKPNSPAPFIPVDPLGFHHLGGRVPVDWVAVPSGSPEMARIIPERLADHPATVIQGHGTFARARSLKEAFFLICVADQAGAVVRLERILGVDVAGLRRRVQAAPGAAFSYPPSTYKTDGDESCDFPGEREILREFHKAGARVFESRLSPFHTGSMSVRGVGSLLYAPKASMPRELGGPLLELPLDIRESDDAELRFHKGIYGASDFQTLMHCYTPEAEAMAHYVPPGESSPLTRLIPIDAEGSFIHLAIPVVPPGTGVPELVRLLQDYKVVIVRGGGVWASGGQSLSEVLHHPSSVREICLYRIGAHQLGLDVRKMEPAKAKKW